MSRQKRTFKAAVNAALDLLADRPTGSTLGSEAVLAAKLSISRTTARSVLAHLAEAGIIDWNGRQKTLLRQPCPADGFPDLEVAAPAKRAEAKLLEWVLRTELAPGTRIHESELARMLDITTALARDLLQDFRSSGLIEKEPNKHWVFRGFTRDYATEMCDMRELIERAAFAQIVTTPGHPALAGIAKMERLHIALLARDDAAMSEFPALDARFHRIICQAANNRFFDEFAQRISLIVHYHYQWNKRDETARNRAAIREHLAVIQAVLQGQQADAISGFDHHLATARNTLLSSVNWE